MQYRQLQYEKYTPAGYSADRKYPVLIFLHGSGTRGDDIARVHQNPITLYRDSYLSRGMVAYIPQCPGESWFDVFEQLTDFIRAVMAENTTDPARVYLLGLSMGGYASWQMLMSHPEFFTSAVVLCGGGMYWDAARLRNVPIWAIHGADDTTVYPEESRKMVDAANRAGGDARLTVLPDHGHDVWTDTLKSGEIFDWMLSHSRTATPEVIRACDNVEKFG